MLGRIKNGYCILIPAGNLLEPALVVGEVLGKDTGLVLGVFGLVVFEEHIVMEQAKDFDFAGDMAHAVAEAFGWAVEQGFGLVNNLGAAQQGDLELGLDTGHGAALEDVVGDDAGGSETAHQGSHGLGVVVDALEQDGLIADDDAAVHEGV